MSASRRVLIVGAAGQLGRELQRSFEGFGQVHAVDRTTVDLTAPEQVRKIVRRLQPEIILNAAAYTAVDRAEAEEKLAYTVNADAPRILAEEAKLCKALLIHYSTDYVFDGSKEGPWIEDDLPAPLNVYGASKLAGERAIQDVDGKYLIFRTTWVYGPHGNNFLLTMLRLGRERERLRVVDDQFGAPTSSIEIADATRKVVEKLLCGDLRNSDEWAGLYHMTCSGSTTWCGFARSIFERAPDLLDGRKPCVEGISSSEYVTAAKRPRNSILSNHAFELRFGFKLAPWETALGTVIERLRSSQ